MTRKLPPLLNHHPLPVRILLAGVVPALFGAIAGVMLGVSQPAYLALALLGVGGGYLAGLEHDGMRGGLLRGAVAGSLFGLWILIAHGVFFDAEPKAHIPDPAVVHVAITTMFGALLGALGGRRRAKLERQNPAATTGPQLVARQDAMVPSWEAIVDINTATPDQLKKLPVVGRGAAERIIAHRDQHGPFQTVEDLVNVEGFSESRVTKIAPQAIASTTA